MHATRVEPQRAANESTGTASPGVQQKTLGADALALIGRPPPADGFTVTRVFEILLLGALAAVPMLAIGYLLIFQDSSLRFEHHGFHEGAIALAIAISSFITFVTWKCYRSSGEPFLRWLTLSFLAFTVVYAPHGLFTRMAHDHLWLFLLYGPASRFVMAACLFIGLLTYGSAVHEREIRTHRGFWLAWGIVLLLVDVAIALAAIGAPQAMPLLRLVMEYGALILSLTGLAFLLASRPGSPLMLLYALALAFFAQSSLAFVLARPWDHLWWLAHAISAGGFLMLGYGVLHAYHTTRSFSLVFSHDEVIKYLRAAKAEADDAAEQLRRANEELSRLAATDPLTGVANRRHFIERTAAEIARSLRSGAPVSLLALDLDHFKQINDRHGHAVGDQVLQRFCGTVGSLLRPSDLLGRLGGEEFMVLLPEAGADDSAIIAERIRAAVAAAPVDALPATTTSIGIATCPNDGDSLEALFRAADSRLYQAKHAGRNTVAGKDFPTGDGDHAAPE
jgi:two-component system, cell cycle response regulator